jgi:uncharacterized protein YktB (UPF0637 family)
MDFPGFARDDFDIFLIPDFAGRMAEIRSRIRPKLVALGADLTPLLQQVVEAPIHPHVAQHMRRRVNPPQETWVAFTRDRKGYKRWTHYRVAVSAAGVRVTVFVEDDADDKPHFGAALSADPSGMLAALGPNTPVQWYTFGDEPVLQSDLTAERLAKAGSALARLKTSKFQAGIPLPADQAAKLTPARFEEWALEQLRLLKPLYLTGAHAPGP